MLLFFIISLIISGLQTDLQTRKILNGRVRVAMPSNFEVMPDDLLVQKYPSGNRPTTVYSNPDGAVNFAVNHTMNRITREQLPEALPVFVSQFQTIYPAIDWVRKEMAQLRGRSFVVMEFVTPAGDTSIYNLMFVTELEGRLLMFSFNCPIAMRSAWESVANEMMHSTEVGIGD